MKSASGRAKPHLNRKNRHFSVKDFGLSQKTHLIAAKNVEKKSEGNTS
jgi:hypothetical protein